MKKFTGIVLATTILLGCADTKKQEKLLLDSVITIHDKVMASDEHLMKNKMLLDSLVKNAPNLKDSALVFLKVVDNADSTMGDWMHKFDVENKGKSHDEIISYLSDQKNKISAIDLQIKAAITESDKYLNQHKK